MESVLPDGEWIEEIENDALRKFEDSQRGYDDRFVRFMPSGQVRR